jgi:hypothetical protein
MRLISGLKLFSGAQRDGITASKATGVIKNLANMSFSTNAQA